MVRATEDLESIPRSWLGQLDAELIAHLERHLTEEADILDEYRALADSDDEPVSYLARLILEDEHRHHRLLTEMLNQRRSGALLNDERPRVPWLSPLHDRRNLRARIRRLRAFERQDLRQLRKLRRQLGNLRRDSLNGLLVDALIMDTRKHQHYLRRLDRLTRGRFPDRTT